MNFFVPLLIGAIDMAKDVFVNLYFYNFYMLKKNYKLNDIDKDYKLNNKDICNILNKGENIVHNNDINNLNEDEVDNKECNKFGSYLAGLFEGDGHIWVPKNKVGKKHNPRFHITFHKNDQLLAEKILKKIGSGFIRIKEKENAVVLTVSPIKGLIYILHQIKDYLRTPKIYQVNNLIEWLNLNKNTKLSLISVNKNNLSSDSWLAGFIDADGGFLIAYSKKENNNRNRDVIKFTMTLDQRIKDSKSNESYKWIMNNISEFFKVNLRTYTRKQKDKSYYRIVCTSKISRTILINYLTEYPLYSSKFLNYLDWKKGSLLQMSNRNLTIEQKSIIFSLKNNMNKQRTVYTWNHFTSISIFN
jgi:hypothetical protein